VSGTVRTKRGRAQLPSISGAALIAALMLLAACGGAGTADRTSVGQQAAATATATTQATPTANAPTPIPPPYSFPLAWHAVAAGAPAVGGFAFAPSALRTGYLCSVLQASAFNSSVAPVFKTTDGGQTWSGFTIPGVTVTATAACALFVNPTDPNDVFYHLGARGPRPSGMGVNGPLPLGNLRATGRRFARAMNPCVVAFGPAPLGDLSH
jgi:hypothetical protein